MKAVSVNKEVLALISKMPETGFVPKRDNVVVFGDMVFWACLVLAVPRTSFFKGAFFRNQT
ncbi:MAG: hypothetical protein AAGU16_03140 [Desulfitobacterium hafniense]